MIALILLSGLASLSNEPYESARVDGATEWQIFWRITLPMVTPTLLTALILRSIDALKTFDIIYAMTGGGPGYSSETLKLWPSNTVLNISGWGRLPSYSYFYSS